MNKKNIHIIILNMLVFMYALCGCDTNSDNTEIEPGIINDYTQYLLYFNDKIGIWNDAIEYGDHKYVLYSKNTDLKDTNNCIIFMSDSEEENCCLYFQENEIFPNTFIHNNNHYSFLVVEDSILEISKFSVNNIEIIDSIQIPSLKFDNSEFDIIKYTCILNTILTSSTALSKSNEDLNSILQKVKSLPINPSNEEITNQMGNNKTIFAFAEEASKIKSNKYDPVAYGVSVTTVPNGTTDITETSATVNGHFYCANKNISNYGKWGVLIATDRNRLTLEECDSIAYASDTDQNFKIRLNNLSPGTKYYWNVFFKFNSSDHGDFYMSYGPKDAQCYIESDWFTREFKTKEANVGYELINYNLLKDPYPANTTVGLYWYDYLTTYKINGYNIIDKIYYCVFQDNSLDGHLNYYMHEYPQDQIVKYDPNNIYVSFTHSVLTCPDGFYWSLENNKYYSASPLYTIWWILFKINELYYILGEGTSYTHLTSDSSIYFKPVNPEIVKEVSQNYGIDYNLVRYCYP